MFGPKNFPKVVIYHSTLKSGSLGYLDCFDLDKFDIFTFRSLFFTKVAISQDNGGIFSWKTKSGRGLKFATYLLHIISSKHLWMDLTIDHLDFPMTFLSLA